MLHITNGDCAVPPLRAAGVDGQILPWRAVLHDGPVPPLDPEGLRAVRAEFLGDKGELQAQDARLADAIGEREPLMLWFEADLFDVLLLVQILDRLPDESAARLVLVGQEPLAERHRGGAGRARCARSRRTGRGPRPVRRPPTRQSRPRSGHSSAMGQHGRRSTGSRRCSTVKT